MLKTFKIALFVGGAGLLNAVPIAAAEPLTGQNVSVVSTAGLDLSSAAGRAKLDHRLVVAANEVCGNPSDADLAGKNRARECRGAVLAQARSASAELASRTTPIRLAAAR